MKRQFLIWLVLGTLASHPIHTAASPSDGYDVLCPAVLEREAVTFVGANTPKGWKAFMPSRLEVQSGFLMYGPPETLETATPTSWKDGKLAGTSTWDFSGIPADEKWLSCSYGAGQELTLSKALPRDVSKCTVTTTKNERGWVLGVTAHCDVLQRKK